MRIIGGTKKRRALIAPKHTYRPTQGVVREAFFNIVDVAGKRVLDLYAGSGAMGFEAASRGAKTVTLVENNQMAIRAMHESAEHLAFQNVRIIRKNVLSFLKNAIPAYDVIFADAPYLSKENAKVIASVDEHALLSDEGVFVLELAEKDPVIATLPAERIRNRRDYGRSILLFLGGPS